MKKLVTLLLFVVTVVSVQAMDIWVEAENFDHKGGWCLDNQSVGQMGSPYLLAHGMGEAVENAFTVIQLKRAGNYRIWVRTRDWVKSWNQTGSPGRFEVWLNGKALTTTFGTERAEWHWQDGGIVSLKAGNNRLELHDLTGFDGRCDAILLTSSLDMLPPDGGEALAAYRRKLSGIPATPKDAGSYDLVVVGGGVAGCCAAVSAARLGCKVALIQNRPVLGGNNSSEVRVGLSGLIAQQPYPKLGNLMDELGGVGHWTDWEAKQDSSSLRSKQIHAILKKHPEKLIHNAGPASNYEDGKKLALIQNEKNVSLFLNMQVFDVRMKDDQIVAVVGKDIETGKEYLFEGILFADCTGDGEVGFLSGADYRIGRESKQETGESSAPEKADLLVMGTSVQWYSEEQKETSVFPECPWAIQFDEKTCIPIVRGDWDWEAGLNNDQITEIEYIRDYALRAVYGNWSYLKNKSDKKEQYAKKKLVWVAYIGGKRESRRLMGDVVLTEQDVLEQVPYEDATFTTTWDIDLHYPKQIPGLKEEPFLSYCIQQKIKPYAVPYRCLYSRNVRNLFMAGRDISVTHVALGTIRVMRTTGMMGEVVGMAASLCKKHQILPRDIYEKYLAELKVLMRQGVGKAGFPEVGF